MDWATVYFGAVGLDIGAALGHCDALDRPNLVSACHEGAFMEAISSAVAERESHPSHAHGSSHVASHRAHHDRSRGCL